MLDLRIVPVYQGPLWVWCWGWVEEVLVGQLGLELGVLGWEWVV